MNNSIDFTLSGLYAHRKKMDVTANNIANINTDGFKKSRVVFEEKAVGGVEVDIQKIETPGNPIHYKEGEKVMHTETSNVDYAQEAVSMIMANTGSEANLRALQTEDEMLGSLLDIII